MKNRIICVVLAVLCTVSLCGCSLARPDAAKAPDRLIGALITTEYLDLFDMEAWFSEHAARLSAGGDNVIDTTGYEGRLYAEVEKNENDLPDNRSISFPGTDGVYYYLAYTSGENGEGYWSSFSDGGVYDLKMAINVTDEGEEIALDGTVYLTPEAGGDDMCFYVNPIYETAAGEFYAVSGDGFGFGSDFGEGQIYSATISDETTVTKNGEKSVSASAVTIRLSLMLEPVCITLYQMDASHQILREDKYAPGTLPDQLTAEREAAYFLIETEKLSSDGSVSIQREIFDDHSEEVRFSTFYLLDNGILAKQETAVLWPDTQASPDPNPPV